MQADSVSVQGRLPPTPENNRPHVGGSAFVPRRGLLFSPFCSDRQQDWLAGWLVHVNGGAMQAMPAILAEAPRLTTPSICLNCLAGISLS